MPLSAQRRILAYALWLVACSDAATSIDDRSHLPPDLGEAGSGGIGVEGVDSNGDAGGSSGDADDNSAGAGGSRGDADDNSAGAGGSSGDADENGTNPVDAGGEARDWPDHEGSTRIRIPRAAASPLPGTGQAAVKERAAALGPEPGRRERSAAPPRSAAAQCTMLGSEITPDITPSDQCTIPFTCAGGVRLDVHCDGENDGTFTSLCECMINGKLVSLSGTFRGEAPESCSAAVPECLARLP